MTSNEAEARTLPTPAGSGPCASPDVPVSVEDTPPGSSVVSPNPTPSEVSTGSASGSTGGDSITSPVAGSIGANLGDCAATSPRDSSRDFKPRAVSANRLDIHVQLHQPQPVPGYMLVGEQLSELKEEVCTAGTAYRKKAADKLHLVEGSVCQLQMIWGFGVKFGKMCVALASTSKEQYATQHACDTNAMNARLLSLVGNSWKPTLHERWYEQGK